MQLIDSTHPSRGPWPQRCAGWGQRGQTGRPGRPPSRPRSGWTRARCEWGEAEGVGKGGGRFWVAMRWAWDCGGVGVRPDSNSVQPQLPHPAQQPGTKRPLKPRLRSPSPSLPDSPLAAPARTCSRPAASASSRPRRQRRQRDCAGWAAPSRPPCPREAGCRQGRPAGAVGIERGGVSGGAVGQGLPAGHCMQASSKPTALVNAASNS